MSSNKLTIQLSEIVVILLNTDNESKIIRQWREFYNILETPSPNFMQWERHFNITFDVFELFNKILENWVSVKKSATTTELETILRNGHFFKCADIITALGDKEILTKLNVLVSNTPKIWFEIPPPVTNFVGRESQLLKLRTFYKGGNSLIVISGFGGIGKSEIVRKFAYSFSNEFNGNCIFLQGDTEDSFNNSVERLCRTLTIGYDKTNLAENVQSILQTLHPDPTLVIIDNIDNQNNAVLSFIRSCKSLQILLPFFVVASRMETVLDSERNNIEVETLEPNEAKELVQNSLDFETNDDDVIKLCKELHNFPLLLQQALCYIKNERLAINPHFNIPDYLVLLQTKKEQLYDHPLSVDHTYGSTIIAALNTTLENILQRNGLVGESAMMLLRILAYTNPYGVDIKYLLDFHKGIFHKGIFHKGIFKNWYQKDQMEQEIGLLQSYSLCTVTYDDGERKMSVHKIVAEVVRLSWSKEKEMNFLGKALSWQSVHYKCKIFNIFHIWSHAIEFNLLVNKYFSHMFESYVWRTSNFTIAEIILARAVNYFGWENQSVLDFEFKILDNFICSSFRQSFPPAAYKYCEMFSNSYKRLKTNFGLEHKNTKRVLNSMHGEYFLSVDLNDFTDVKFLDLVELLKDLINFDDWLMKFNYFFISVIKSSHTSNYLEKIREITNIVVKKIRKNVKKRQTFLWMLKLISIEFKKLKRFEDFESIQEIIFNTLSHPSERVLVDLTTYKLFFEHGLLLVQHSIKNKDFSLLKYLLKFDLNNFTFQKIINELNQNEPDLASEFCQLVLNALKTLHEHRKYSLYDAICITTKLKLSFSQLINLIENWEFENLKPKFRHNSSVFDKTIALTNHSDSEILKNLLVEARILNFDIKKLEQNIYNLRNEEAKSILIEIMVLSEKREVSRDETLWLAKEICGFLFFRGENEFVVNWILKKIIPTCSSESELKVMRQFLNQIAFHICHTFYNYLICDRCEVGFSCKCEVESKYSYNRYIDSTIEILFALFKYEFHLPLLYLISGNMVQGSFCQNNDQLFQVRERFLKRNGIEERNTLNKEVNIALRVIDNNLPNIIKRLNLSSHLALTKNTISNEFLSGYTVQKMYSFHSVLSSNFVRRKLEMSQIQSFLNQKCDKMMFVCGSEGVGKTELTKAIFNSSTDFMSKFWFDISNHELHFITRMRSNQFFLTFNELYNSLEDVVEAASKHRTLLVLDHPPKFDHLEDLKQLLSIFQNKSNLHILYITRGDYPLNIGCNVQIGALTINESECLVIKVIDFNPNNSRKSILRLCAETGNHPLVLSQALQTINNHFGGDIEKYLKTYAAELKKFFVKETSMVNSETASSVVGFGITGCKPFKMHTLTQKIINMLSYFDSSALVDIEFIVELLKTDLLYDSVSNTEVLYELKFINKFHFLCTLNETDTQLQINKKAQVVCRTDLSVLGNSNELAVLKTLTFSFKVLLQSPNFKPINLFHVVNGWNYLRCYGEVEEPLDILKLIKQTAIQLKCTLKIVDHETQQLKLINVPS